MKKKSYLTIVLILSIVVSFAQGPHTIQLYGMTQYGGVDHKGTIFHYTPYTRTITTDYEFKIIVKGKTPKGELVTDNNGHYYGTTTQGGTLNAGLIFKWDSITSEYTELYQFNTGTGRDARGAMVLYNGKFYGMTNSGGANGFGVIYEWDPATNVYIDKIDMDSINGKNPDGTLTLIGTKFYGVTRNGGTNDQGVIFDWDPATNIYIKRYNFTSSTGANPVGKLSPFGGKLYAMTNLGGANNKGVIYEWNYTTNTYTKKIDFNGTNGAYPMGYLTLSGTKFYGLTYEGGVYETALPTDHYGTLFEWNPATNAFVKKRDLGALIFSQQSTHGPLGSMTLKGNVLWGITSEGHVNGGIFSWNLTTNTWTDYFLNHAIFPPYTYVKNEDFFQAPGTASYGALLLSGNKLLGASSAAGGGNVGCIFEYAIDSNRISRSVHMEASEGAYPKGSLSRIGNKLYGMTQLGGENHCGNIFEWDMSTNQFSERVAFNGYTNGSGPWGSLHYYDGKFYGTVTGGRSKSNFVWNTYGNRYSGHLFSWDPVTNDYEIKLENTLVGNCKAWLELHDGYFYTAGGGGSYGSVLAYNPVTNTATDTALFNGTNGHLFQLYQDHVSANGLTYYNGKYYGMTPSKFPGTAGSTFRGGIYEWDPVTNVITNKVEFTDTTGFYPFGSLTLVGDVFYGLTTNMPVSFGSLFKWDPTTNVYEKKQELAFAHGYYINNPRGTMTYSGGKLYGLSYGFELHSSAGTGSTFPGTVFEYDPLLDSITVNKTFTYTGGLSNSGVNPAFTKLLEVIPNELPVLVSTPAAQTICSSENGSVTFTLTDADNDTMSFVITGSDTTLIPLSAISITNTGSVYTINYSSVYNLSGVSVITITADDGYGGTVNFSFSVTVNALPDNTVIQNLPMLSAQQNGATYQWINCATLLPVAGAIAQDFTAAISGTYAVVVTNASCTDTSACVAVIILDIDENSTENHICVQPNPAEDEVFVSVSKNISDKIRSVKIMNVLGEVMIEQQEANAPIHIAMLTAGVYFLNVETTTGVYTTRFIKQ